MGRKSYRGRTARREVEKQATTPAPRYTPPAGAENARPAPGRRYTPRTGRTTPVQADFTDEAQYVHVRQDLIRIGLLAFCLFGSLILLRVITAALGLLP
jgi:hypothetical protein